MLILIFSKLYCLNAYPAIILWISFRWDRVQIIKLSSYLNGTVFCKINIKKCCEIMIHIQFQSLSVWFAKYFLQNCFFIWFSHRLPRYHMFPGEINYRFSIAWDLQFRLWPIIKSLWPITDISQILDWYMNELTYHM